MSSVAVSPTQADAKPAVSKRIEGYDVARSLAILGMIIVNFKVVLGSSYVGADWLIFLTSLVEGRAVALFVMLAGVGLSLLSRRAYHSGDETDRQKARRRVLKRSAFLLVFGLLLTPLWPADILHFYSLYLVIGAALLFVPDRQLLWSALGVVLIFPVLYILLDYDAGWDWKTLTITDFWTPVGLVRHLFFNGFHPVFPWAGYLVFGMWLGRQPVQDAIFRRKLLLRGIIVWIIAEVASALLLQILTPIAGIEIAYGFFGRDPIPPSPLYMLSAGSCALVILLLVISLGERLSNSRVWHTLVTTGQYALTFYVAHIIIGMGIMEAFGWIMTGSKSLAFAMFYSLAFYAAGIVFTLLWRSRFGRGPFEAFMRVFTD